MSKITKFVVWICSRFSRKQVEAIVAELTHILKDANSRFGPLDEFKEEHPNYRNFAPDPTEPLTEPTKKKLKRTIK
jgi:hypothetical protein